VDTVCNGGSNNRNLCGAFEIFDSTCTGGGGSPSPSPSPSASPSPTPPPGPVCLNITKSPATPTIGSQVTFTCGQVTGAVSYEFRVKLPNGTIQALATSTGAGSRISVPLLISTAGTYQAQCRICTAAAGTNAPTCQAFEPL
jgi:hypothetical protein